MSKVTVDNLRKASESADRDISGVAAAWVHFSVLGGAVTLEDSLNVSSLTDVGVGTFSVNFTNNMSNALYSLGVSSQFTSAAGTGAFFSQEDQANRTVGMHRLNHYQNATTADPLRMSSSIHGDLA